MKKDHKIMKTEEKIRVKVIPEVKERDLMTEIEMTIEVKDIREIPQIDHPYSNQIPKEKRNLKKLNQVKNQRNQSITLAH